MLGCFVDVGLAGVERGGGGSVEVDGEAFVEDVGGLVVCVGCC